ncbi:MAG: hypothetical protein ACN6PK_13785 [Pseudomonas shirazensis]
MNLENLPGQLFALALGWSFTVFIQNRSNRRAEALKRKDKIIDKLEDLADWVESEIDKDDFSSVRTESTFSGLVTQIEVRIGHLNRHIGKDIFDAALLSKLREIEIHPKPENNVETPYLIRDAAADVTEQIEMCCDQEYFAKRGVVAALNDYYQWFKGGIALVVLLGLFVALFQFYKNYIYIPLGTCVYGSQCVRGPVPPPLNDNSGPKIEFAPLNSHR